MINPQPGRTIPLSTYLGTDVPNSIDLDPTPGMVAFSRQQVAPLIGAVGVTQVGSPTGRYNCHGLVFGSRRTNIPPPGTDSVGLVDRILHEDQYTQVPEADTHEGDVVLWRQAGEIVHTGIVSHFERYPIRVAFVWSMWGGLGEFVHRVQQTPYQGCRVEYWRLA